jgi:hypothetical protein
LGPESIPKLKGVLASLEEVAVAVDGITHLELYVSHPQ